MSGSYHDPVNSIALRGDAVSETVSVPGGTCWQLDDEDVARLSAPTSERGRLQRATLALLLDWEQAGELPTSIRFAFYALEQLGIVNKEVLERPKGVKGRRPDQDLIDAFTHLREKGLVPWDWIRDDRRTLQAFLSAPSVAAYVAATVAGARINPWLNEPTPVLLCESAAVAGVLAGLATRYVVPLSGLSGMTNGFLRTVIAPFLADEDMHVLYIGDHDFSGGQIEASAQRILEDELDEPLQWERLALTEAQLDLYDLRRLTIQKTDKRTGRTHPAVEAEALGQTVLRTIVTERLDALLPEPLDDVLLREQQQRTMLSAFLNELAASQQIEVPQ